MRDPVEFRRYAEECRRLAKMMPAEHRGTLLKIAEIECAQEAERDVSKTEAGEPSEDASPRSFFGFAKQNRAGRPPPSWWV
jgi:hypothetical protein